MGLVHGACAWGFCSMREQKRIAFVLDFCNVTCFNLLVVKYLQLDFQLQGKCKEQVKSSV